MVKTFSVALAGQNWRFAVAPELTVMQAARVAGINLPSSCRNGTCRTCMCMLLQGTVRYQIAWPGLSTDEQRDGLILPCVAHAQSDLVLQEPRARRADPVAALNQSEQA
ncbi:MAG: 2Fe-2S iron-sulfur cluster binding domain-containing protein [Pseudomonadota bacterium]|nr:2Fe-2S iron-sulfur cluster binding domain-containing protein [Pseudomonadota bacterium]